MADQAVRAAGHQLGLILCDIGAPQLRPMWRRAQMANPSPSANRKSSRPARHGSELMALLRNAPKRSRRITKTTTAALIRKFRHKGCDPFHGKSCHERIDPECSPADEKDEFDCMQTTQPPTERIGPLPEPNS